MQVHCPQCGAIIPADDMNLQTLAARCRQCNDVFSIADIVRRDAGAARVPPGVGDALIPMPGRMRVDEMGAAWSVSWRWFTPSVIFLIIFSAVWDSFLVFWYSAAMLHNAPWIMIVFPMAHVAAGIAMTYAAIACIFNTTVLGINGSYLTVRHGPLPWRGNISLNSDDIRQIFFKPATVNNRNRSSVWYGVYAVDKDSQLTQLVSGITDINEAIFLQRALERRLRLKPSPIWPAI